MAKPERHVLVEYGPWHPLSLETDDDAQRFATGLRRLSNSWQRTLGLPGYIPPFEAHVRGSTVRVKTRGVTGTVRVGPFELVVAPKYLADAVSSDEGSQGWEHALASLVAVGAGARHLIDSTVSAQAAKSRGFVELFARSYADALRLALGEGLPRQYQLRNERLPVVRGRIAVERLYPRALYAPHEVPVEYPDYSADTPLGRLLRWAADEFVRLPIRARTSGRLSDLSARMRAVVPVLPEPAAIERVRLGPQHRHVQPALGLARWLASGRYGSPGAGRASVPGLLLHSDRVFEAFVLAATRAAGRQIGYRSRQAEHKMAVTNTAARAIWTKPDGELLLGDRVACVIDAKYKEWVHHPKTADVYQVLAGARVLAAPEAALVYPAPRRRPPQTWDIIGEGNPSVVHAWFVAPMALAEPGGYARVVDDLATDLSATLRQASAAA